MKKLLFNKVLIWTYVFLILEGGTTNGCFYTCSNEPSSKIQNSVEKSKNLKLPIFIQENSNLMKHASNLNFRNSIFKLLNDESKLKENWTFAGYAPKQLGLSEKIKNTRRNNLVELDYNFELHSNFVVALTFLTLGLIPSASHINFKYSYKIFDQNGKVYEDKILVSTKQWAGWIFLPAALMGNGRESSFFEESIKFVLSNIEEKIQREKIPINQSETSIASIEPVRPWFTYLQCGSEIRRGRAKFSSSNKKQLVCAVDFAILNQSGHEITIANKDFFLESANSKTRVYGESISGTSGSIKISKENLTQFPIFFLLPSDFVFSRDSSLKNNDKIGIQLHSDILKTIYATNETKEKLHEILEN